ncbi:phosphodiester glycosidase family protein [uncultured Hyphomonas sp.]|uniref:phosphodiester glycosidase family protein n=1 Tax=uncultured Hyphomonas sp. TaxID=225298 RepID=UPI002AAB4FCD|nr:phosphodiester glycosidase family protein [uncultured Hyphomonas sp.]
MRTWPILLLLLLLPACREETVQACEAIRFEDQPFTVCHFAADDPGLALFHTHADGAPFADFDRLAETIAAEGGDLIFAMNAGMYHEDRRPVGLYVENSEQTARLVTNAGPGNFGMLPNGVFWLDGEGTAHVTETLAYEALAPEARFATQSGPMLVIDGALHPAFNPDGTSRKRRNGVGLSADGDTLWFAISDAPVNFDTFARLFRDQLRSPDALYLDGVVSRLHAPSIGRDDGGTDMGPIVAIVRSPARNAR